eukprot:Rhum_TRINITY_DN14342_c11_g1::Rhum_TRINITY_DN14342_c11_g1_i1::g.81209::m.81209
MLRPVRLRVEDCVVVYRRRHLDRLRRAAPPVHVHVDLPAPRRRHRQRVLQPLKLRRRCLPAVHHAAAPLPQRLGHLDDALGPAGGGVARNVHLHAAEGHRVCKQLEPDAAAALRRYVHLLHALQLVRVVDQPPRHAPDPVVPEPQVARVQVQHVQLPRQVRRLPLRDLGVEPLPGDDAGRQALVEVRVEAAPQLERNLGGVHVLLVSLAVLALYRVFVVELAALELPAVDGARRVVVVEVPVDGRLLLELLELKLLAQLRALLHDARPRPQQVPLRAHGQVVLVRLAAAAGGARGLAAAEGTRALVLHVVLQEGVHWWAACVSHSLLSSFVLAISCSVGVRGWGGGGERGDLPFSMKYRYC